MAKYTVLWGRCLDRSEGFDTWEDALAFYVCRLGHPENRGNLDIVGENCDFAEDRYSRGLTERENDLLEALQ